MSVRGYLGFEVARVGEQQASRELLKWSSSSRQGYGPRRPEDVLLADALYCNQVDLALFGQVATRGFLVRANRSVGAVADAARLLDDGEKAVCTIKGDRTVVRSVPLQWPEVGEDLRLVEVRRDGGVPLLFVTDLPWSLERLARIGRERWGIENNLHKDLKHQWPWTYLPSKTLRGLKAWWWLVAIAINLFYAFFNRQVQPRLAQLGRAVFGTVRAAREYLTRHIADESLPSLIEQEDYG